MGIFKLDTVINKCIGNQAGSLLRQDHNKWTQWHFTRSKVIWKPYRSTSLVILCLSLCTDSLCTDSLRTYRALGHYFDVVNEGVQICFGDALVAERLVVLTGAVVVVATVYEPVALRRAGIFVERFAVWCNNFLILQDGAILHTNEAVQRYIQFSHWLKMIRINQNVSKLADLEAL